MPVDLDDVRPPRQGDPVTWVPASRQPLLEQYESELREWTRRVNLISKPSESDIRHRHVGHSLCLAARPFPDGATVVDWGTGGGLPAVPLAIAFPKVAFVAVDSIAKKTAALRMMVRSLGLDNLEVWQGRAEDFDQTASHFVSRATAPLRDLWKWSRRAAAGWGGSGSGTAWSSGSDGGIPAATEGPAGPAPWEPGLVCLKGGDLGKEIRQARPTRRVSRYSIQEMTGMPWSEDKYILHLLPPGAAPGSH